RTLLTIGRGGMEFALYDGLVTDAEIDHLKSLASTRLKKSTVLGDNFSRAASDVRTSEDTFLEVGCDPVVAALEARISAVTGIPVECGEGLQILHYGTTQEYKPHFDFFDPASQQEHAIMAASGNRVGTMILYLGEVERGGSTYFPKLDLAVHPQRGQAVWFGYLRDGLLDERSQHAGMPILGGEKWIATKWFRERRFGSPPGATASS
ncbi:MAG TPA: 2OG-Fe(II) oxygenase, partial [Rhodanobacteraceae bacterium]|nr:2OG-Fe(II) oxygenase [Rhodanobacteraceae bacterium]